MPLNFSTDIANSIMTTVLCVAFVVPINIKMNLIVFWPRVLYLKFVFLFVTCSSHPNLIHQLWGNCSTVTRYLWHYYGWYSFGRLPSKQFYCVKCCVRGYICVNACALLPSVWEHKIKILWWLLGRLMKRTFISLRNIKLKVYDKRLSLTNTLTKKRWGFSLEKL